MLPALGEPVEGLGMMAQAFGAEPLNGEQAPGPWDRLISGDPSDETYPVSAYNSLDEEYLIVWMDDADPDYLHAYILGWNGQEVSPEFTIAGEGVGAPTRPELVYNPTDNSFMLLWSEPTGNFVSYYGLIQELHDLFALPLSSDGTPLNASATLITDQQTFFDIRTAYDLVYNSAANEYLVTWEMPPGIVRGVIYQPHTVYGQRMDASGVLQGSPVLIIAGVVGSIRSAYSPSSDEYIVTFDISVYGSLGYELYAQRLEPDTLANRGGIIGINGNAIGWQSNTRIAYAETTDRYLITFEDTRPVIPGNYIPDIYGQVVQAGTGGLVGGNFPILESDDPVGQGDVEYISSADQFLVVGLPSTNHLTIRLLAADGEILSTPYQVTDLFGIQVLASARTGSDSELFPWLLTWNTDGDIYAQIPEKLVVSDGAVVCSYPECFTAEEATQRTTKKPINTRTGAYDYIVEDLAVQTTAGPLSLRRTYASFTTGTQTDPLGFGWTYNHAARLIFPGDPGGQEGVVLFKAESANLFQYIDNGDGTYSTAPGVCGELIQVDGPPIRYIVSDNAQNTYVFDEYGVLLNRTDAQDHSWNYTYWPEGWLEQITDDTGDRWLFFDYDIQGRLETVEDHMNRSVVYSYDANGDLVGVTDVLGQLWTYTYDVNHNLTEVIDPRGITVERTEFDAEGRAVRQYNGEDALEVEITYNPDGTSTVTDGLGNARTDSYDFRKTLTEGADALGGTTDRAYDLNFRPATLTDETGAVTQLDWSEDGANLTQVIDAEGNQTDLTYDGLNNLTDVVDPRGFLTTYTYDGTLLTSSTDALNNTTSYTYTPEGYLESVTDARGNTTSYTYDAYGQRTSMTDALGNTWTYDYDDLGRLIDTTDPFFRVTHNDYDAAGRLIKVTRNYQPGSPQNQDNEENIVTEYVYDEAGNQVEVIDTYGSSTQYIYDDANRLVQTIDALGNMSTNAYDLAGNLVSTTDALGRTTTYVYDELNRLVETIDPLGNSTTTAYNPDGTVASTADALGRTTSYTYDDLKRVVATTDPLGNSTSTVYDEAGNVVSTIDAEGRTTTFEYDALGRLILQVDPLGGETEHFYDAVGNRVQTIDPNGHAMTYAYDELNRLETVTDALGYATTYAYDEMGNRESVTDGNGNTTYFYYDALDRLAAVRAPLNHWSYTYYDALGNVIERENPNFNLTTYVYDALNRLISVEDPLLGVTTYAYDVAGNQTSVTDANGHTTTTAYDELNRPEMVTDALGHSMTTAFDAAGNTASITDALGNTTGFAYDALNRQTGVTDPLGETTSYAYDDVGNRTAMTDANEVETRYEYDDLNRLTAVVENYIAGEDPDHETNVRTEYAYDAVGNRLTIRDGNGHLTYFVYDAVNRIIQESDALDHSWHYGYDGVGNRTSLSDAEGFITLYNYDDANRLVGIIYPPPDSAVSFSYDAAGNRLAMSDGVGTTTWEYDELNRVTAVTDPFGETVSYDYDAVGNRASLGYPDGKVVDYTYDAADRMTEVLDWDGQTTSYAYDVVNRLLTTSLPNGVASSYSYDDAGQVLNITHATATDTLSSFSYVYDPIGNRTQAVEYYKTPGGGPTVTVVVADEYGFPMPDLTVYVFDGATYTGHRETTGSNGGASITLPEGSYRFRVDVNGTQYWSGETNHCAIPGCNSVLMTIPSEVYILVQDTEWNQHADVPVYAFDGGTYTGFNGTTDDYGYLPLQLPEGDYRFRADFNGTQFWSGEGNHCPVPGCNFLILKVTVPVTVNVEDSMGMPQAGIPVYVFDGATYTGYNSTSDENGEVTFTLPEGNYRFRADSGGTQFWSDDVNHCTIPGCLDATVVVPVSVTVTIEDTNGTPKEGVPVYGFDGSTYTGFTGTSDVNGEVTLTLPEGSYRFRADYDGTQFWSGEANHCAVPGCSTATVQVTLPVTVTVEDTDSTPKEGVLVYVFDGSTYTSYNDTTDVNGEVSFTLLPGSYRFRADYNGTQFWSDSVNHCMIPGCETATVVVTLPMTVMVEDGGGSPLDGVPVYVFDGSTYTGKTGATNIDGEVEFTLVQGSYRFRADYGGEQYWSGAENHCDIPGCEAVAIVAGAAPTATPTPTETPTPEPAPTDTPTPVPTPTPTDTPEPTATPTPTDSAYVGRVGVMAMVRPAPAGQPLLEPAAVTVTVQDTNGAPKEGLPIYVFDGSSYTGINGISDVNGEVVFDLQDGSYRFRSDLNGTQFWSGTSNHCDIPGCSEATVEVTIPVTVTVQDTDGVLKEGVPVYAFDGSTYTGYTGTSDVNGEVLLTLPQGDYRFRADYDGTQFWSGEADHCAVPGCEVATVEVTLPVVVTVLDTDAVPQVGLPVYAFDGSTYTGYTGTSDVNGEVLLTLPQGDYRFRADLNGTQFWSDSVNHCTIPGCETSSITVTIPVTVTVQSQTGSPYPYLPVYAFDGETYTGFNRTSNENGEVFFTLPVGDYRFRSDYDGVQFWSGEANHCTIPGCLEALVEIPGGVGAVTVTIDYAYDPLYRLTEADYSTGEYFYYTYDSVGNRLTQETHEGTNLYVYDIANRLIDVDGTTFIWDDNGNLIQDDRRIYHYDHANRLDFVFLEGDSYNFSNNGLGNRLRQTLNGVPTEYTLDINRGLMQVLTDGTNAYLYGARRISEEQPEGWQYHLGEALGSMRQLTASTGVVTLAQAYEPYGSVLKSLGNAASNYGFTGEWTDGTGLVNLRARYYASYLNQWIQPDPIVPDPYIPADWNRYAYVRNNPINYTDPAGLCIRGDTACLGAALDLYHRFNWRVFWSGYADAWTVRELRAIQDAGHAIAGWLDAHGGNGEGRIRAEFGPATFHHAGLGWILKQSHHVQGDNLYMLSGFASVDVIHEMGHILDNLHSPHLLGSIIGGGPSDAMVSAMGIDPTLCLWRFECGLSSRSRYNLRMPMRKTYEEIWRAALDSNPDVEEPPFGSYGGNYARIHGPSEDFAATFEMIVAGTLRSPAPRRAAWFSDYARSLTKSATRLEGDPYTCWTLPIPSPIPTP